MSKTILNVFVTNLGKYTEGYLIGEWLELPATDEEINEVLKRIGINERYEEYFITDFESDFFNIGEYENINHLNELAQMVDDLDEWQLDVLESLMEITDDDIEDAIEKLDDCILYSDCDDFTDLAYRLVDELDLLHDVPEDIKNYFDFAAYGRDLSFDNFYETSNGILEICY